MNNIVFFRLILIELGYQAGQHELLSDTFMKTLPQKIKLQVKETHNQIENHKKDIKTIQSKLDKAYKKLDKSKAKYIKHHAEWESSKEAFKNAEADSTSSKNEIEKMQQRTIARRQQVEDYKGEYAQQLVRTNLSQAAYFHSELPAVLDSLQNLSQSNCAFFKRIWSKFVGAEKEVAFIITKCHEEMENVIHEINPDEDTEKVIEKYKTGNVPPPDLQFDDLSDEYSTVVGPNAQTKDRVGRDQGDEWKVNLYQKKRELERKIQAQQMKIKKGQAIQ